MDAALATGADLIVSGDQRDPPQLGSYKGIPIITAVDVPHRVKLH